MKADVTFFNAVIDMNGELRGQVETKHIEHDDAPLLIDRCPPQPPIDPTNAEPTYSIFYEPQDQGGRLMFDAFQVGDQWGVYALTADKMLTGDPLSLHADENEARATLRSMNRVMHKTYAAPKPVGILSRRKEGLTVLKGSDGLRLMFIVTSNGYRDRENETIATKALQEYVDSAWAVEDKCLPNNPLLFWHDGAPIGEVIWTNMEGPFLLEVAKEIPNATVKLTTKGTEWEAEIKSIWDAIETKRYRWGASHGFKYPDSAKQDGVYKRIAKFETSVLPLDAAANPYTFAGVIDDMNKDTVLEDLTNMPGIADKFRKGIRAVKNQLDARGLEHKDLSATKAMLDDAKGVLDKAFAKLSDKVPDGFSAEVLHQLHMAMANDDSEPDGDEGDDPATDQGKGQDKELSTPVRTSAPVVPSQTEIKQMKLMERLISSQEQLVNDSIETRAAVVAIAETVKSLSPISTSVKALEDSMEARIKALEARLSGAPRRASTAESTVVDDAKLTEKAAAQAERYEEFLPGIRVKPGR